MACPIGTPEEAAEIRSKRPPFGADFLDISLKCDREHPRCVPDDTGNLAIHPGVPKSGLKAIRLPFIDHFNFAR